MASDLRRCCEDGIEIKQKGKVERLRLVVTDVKGDLPFLQEVGQLDRHFRRAPKRGSSALVGHGVCHLCCAGMENLPFTDVSESPGFERTMNSLAAMAPWEAPSPFTLQMPSYGFPPELYKPDVWHNWHLGHGRYFISSAVVSLLELFQDAGAGVVPRLKAMSQHWRAYCAAQKKRPYLLKFTRENLSFLSSMDWPEGGWQKASTTTLLMDACLHAYLD